jgi:hypothetical protein
MKSILFDPKEKMGPVIVFIGKRGTGKSFLVRDLLWYHQSIPIGTIISGTEIASPYFQNFIPKIFIHDEYNSEIIQNVLLRQQKILKKIDEEKKAFNRNVIDPRTFLILDDCLYDDKWSRDKLMRFLFMNGRHMSTMLAITMQYPLGIPPALRTNVDYVFILRENVLANRKRIYENYASMFPTFELFCTIMDQTTENHECLVIHNGAKSNKLQDQIFWYKAQTHPDFKIGAKEFWELSKNLPEDNGHIFSTNNKKSGSQVKVNKSGW